MKRLWMRLGLLAGILATGGAGALVANRDPDDASNTVAEAPDEPAERPMTSNPIQFGGEDVEAGNLPSPAVIRANDTESSYGGGAPVQPAADYESLGNAPDEPTTLSVGDVPDSQYSEPGAYSDPAEYPETVPAESEYAPRYADEAAMAPLETPGELDPAARTAGPYDAPVVASPTADAAYANGGYASELQEVPQLPPEPDVQGAEAYAADTAAATEDNLLAPPPMADTELQPQGEYVGPAPEVYPAAEPAPPSSPAVIADAPIRDEVPYTQDEPYAQSDLTGSPPPSPAAPSLGSTSPGAAAVGAAAVGAATLASATPGNRQLEGVQTPTLALEKQAPSEISVGQETTFEIVVRNVGKVAARGVVVTDRVPDGTQLVGASPEFTQTNDGALAWALGDIEPGDQATITIDLMPLKEGEIGSVAQLSFQAQASVRTVSTKPGLVVEHNGPEKVLKGEDVVFNITLSNPGTGVTTGVVVEEDVPEGLIHFAGNALEYEVGTLRPGEEKKLRLILKADKARVVTNVLRARADAGLEASDESTLEVIAPDLRVAIGGPKTRYLERQVTYEIAVANPGTATAYDVGLVTILPRGLKFVSADNKGSYDPRKHAVYWSLAELQPQDQGTVKLTALPIETGEQKIRLEGRGNLGLQAEHEHTTTVQALTELAFTVQDTQDPIEVDAETTYDIRVVNNGNKAATNVQLAAVFPPALTPLRGDGPSKVVIEGQQVIMAPLDKIEGRDEVVYRVAAKGVAAGDHIIAVQIASDEVPTPVVKQESTKVYADR